ncbi:MAG: DNA-directed DNA polymerase [Candidatus Parvarchaeota archaeon]|nr:DNA-directed DNA polymerase [Candidatus Rehaiarchaeum fermentans]
METNGYLIDIDYYIEENSPVIEIYIVNEKGKERLLFKGFKPYFYSLSLPEINDERIENIEKVKKIVNGKEIELYKIYTKIPADVKNLRNYFESYESDILFTRRFLIDKDISSVDLLKIDHSDYVIQKIEKISNQVPNFKVLAFDIEVFSRSKTPIPSQDPIISISTFYEGEQKVFTWLKNNKYETLKDESECILKFFEYIKEKDPAILIGYNSDNFDLPYIKKRAEILNLNLPIEIEIKNKEELKECRVKGFCHIDVYTFIKNIYSKYNLKSEKLTLDEVAYEMLNEKKDQFDWSKAQSLFEDSDLSTQLCDYNLKDSYLTYKIYKEIELHLIEINRLIGLTLFDISRMTSGMIVEYMLMKRAKERNILIPNKPTKEEVYERINKKFQGAFVYQPSPGIYENVAVVDFRSLYPSIIIANNIDPFTIRKENNQITFSKDFKGLIPETVEEVFKLRSEAKDQLKKDKENKQLMARVSVLKLIANSFYGYLGYANSRLYSFECGAEVARLGREYILKTISFMESKGFKVVYADTDSNFLTKNSKNLEQEIKEILKEYNETLPKPMELELQGVYKRALFVKSQKGNEGARKKYALLSENGEIIIKGFQSVRRDWSLLAKEIQYEVIKLILNDKKEEALNLVRKTIEMLNKGEVSLDKLVIHTMLRKDLSSYEQAGRHVEAARKSGIDFQPGETIDYIIAKGREKDKTSSKAVLFKIAKEKGLKYDSNYYINNQIIPSVLSIFETVGIKKEDILGKRSDSLLRYG